MIGRPSNDHLDGGPNAFVTLGDGWRDPNTGDRAGYGGAPNGATVNLVSGTASGWGSDTLAGIENVFGMLHADTLVGNDAPNVLWGWNGSDNITGGAGMDRIFGGDDAGSADADDVISGGAAGDWIDAGNGADTVSGDEGDDRILGGQGGDTIRGNDVNDEVLGGIGKDDVQGQTGNIRGEEGDDQLLGGAATIGSTAAPEPTSWVVAKATINCGRRRRARNTNPPTP